ncbi:DUF192 domain-containing protein [Gilvimarinus sp. SDUM040013]|uniref:DUF192 domain-containing protein n=1 Tax=Gilvimarinus gilvus TaxID=3058038 RepID=A0ABU4S3A3_9GAMM|nr:DUF192 domain-containing protein [Gilvimarinus sp. SDUM040013]MDO3386261.1 DUF192 domain-containing protein [Gilvimarinus sp. SDUM040013]MDX6849744.1 DUF192 domain-containing protein [Gilvimarinus sp. SDUM040013]
MIEQKVLWQRDGSVVKSGSLHCASTYWQRARGLLGRPSPASGIGLKISPCSSVHTFFMGYAIDLVYLSRENIVLKVVTDLKPWRVSATRGAHSVVEYAAGEVDVLGIQVGDVCVYC